MLNYSNTHRRDPHVKKYALKCALTLAAIIAVGFILFNYAGAIWHGISASFLFICSGVVATANFLKPVFSSVGQYILWGGLLVCLWSLCVYFKIDEDCEASKMQWRFFGVSANAFLFIYTILYFVYLNNNDDPFTKYGPFYGFLWFYFIISGMCFVIEHKDKSNQNQ
jgi:hypothetical protein